MNGATSYKRRDAPKVRGLIFLSVLRKIQTVHSKIGNSKKPLQKTLDYLTRELCTKFGMDRAISYRRTDIPKIRGLIFKCFSKTKEVHLKFEIPKSASITVSRHNKEAVHKIWNESDYLIWKSDVPKIGTLSVG